jgi:hypothetical protein
VIRSRIRRKRKKRRIKRRRKVYKGFCKVLHGSARFFRFFKVRPGSVAA